jgi:hypothetical protein
MYGVGCKNLSAIKSMHKRIMVYVRIGRKVRRKFKVDDGLCQGCVRVDSVCVSPTFV